MQYLDIESRRVRVTAPMTALSADGADESILPGEYRSREAGDSVLMCDNEGHVLSRLEVSSFWGSVAWRRIVFLSW